MVNEVGKRNRMPDCSVPASSVMQRDIIDHNIGLVRSSFKARIKATSALDLPDWLC